MARKPKATEAPLPRREQQSSASHSEPDTISPLLVGYVFPGPAWENKTPLDFRTDKETGLRKGLTVKPASCVKHNLKPGTEGCVIPPLATWRGGKYFNDLPKEGKEAFGDYLSEWEEFDAYIVTGEFTPGNYIARIYVLPKAIATDPEPPHPLEWSEDLQKGNAVTTYTQTTWTNTGGSGRPWAGGSHVPGSFTMYHKPATPAAPVTPKLPPPPPKVVVPAKVRVRCGGCGHWFKMDDLGAHAEYCCPGINGPDSDWAFQCECCHTLDEVQTPKAGFPRPKKAEPKKKEEVKKDGDSKTTAVSANGKAAAGEEAGAEQEAETVGSTE